MIVGIDHYLSFPMRLFRAIRATVTISRGSRALAPQYAKAIFDIMVGHSFDEGRQHFLRQLIGMGRHEWSSRSAFAGVI